MRIHGLLIFTDSNRKRNEDLLAFIPESSFNKTSIRQLPSLPWKVINRKTFFWGLLILSLLLTVFWCFWTRRCEASYKRELHQLTGELRASCNVFNKSSWVEIKNGLIRVTEPTGLSQIVDGCSVKNDTTTPTDWTDFRIDGEHSLLTCGDVVQVGCYTVSRSNNDSTVRLPLPDYDRVMVSILKSNPNPNTGNATSTPKHGVFILLLDAVSHSLAKTYLPNTISVLQRLYGATTFPNLNRIALNSRPNAYGLLAGVRIHGYPGNPSEIGKFCQTPVDRESLSSFVFYHFRDMGFTTFINEDSSSTFFGWNGCKNFKQQPVDHYLRPFQIAYHQKPEVFDEVVNMSCLTLEHTQQFFDTYRFDSRPQAALTWLSTVAHDSEKHLKSADQSLAMFFESNAQALQNSFVFFMADHGPRYRKKGSPPWLGERDVNNPMLTVGIPKALRANMALKDNILANSKLLVSQYDLHVTLMDIVGQNSEGWAEFGEKSFAGQMRMDRGSSILRPIARNTRNCKDMDISDKFCMCYKENNELTRFDKNDTGVRTVDLEAIKAVILDALNDLILTKGVSDLCEVLHFGEFMRISQMFADEELCSGMDPQNDTVTTKILNIYFTVTPGNGTFQALVEETTTSEKEDPLPKYQLVGSERVDRYGNQSHCVTTSELKPICYCKDLGK